MLWSPDTCGCQIEYDSSLNYIQTVKACSKHSSVSGTAQHLVDVLAHNRKKNDILNWLTSQNSAPLSIGYNVSAPALNDPVLVTLPIGAAINQTALDSKFGSGKVVLILVAANVSANPVVI